MSSMSVYSAIKHRGMSQSNYKLTVTINYLSSEVVAFPDFLFFKWSTTRQVYIYYFYSIFIVFIFNF